MLVKILLRLIWSKREWLINIMKALVEEKKVLREFASLKEQEISSLMVKI